MAVFAATLFSCEDYLSTDSSTELVENEIFSDVAKTEQQMMGIYDLLGENRSYRKHLTVYTGVNTDIEMHTGSFSEYNLNGATGDRKSMSIYNMNPLDSKDGYNDAGGKDPFSRIYTGIERCNLAIQGIRQYGDTTNTQFKFLLGEALTLRAFFYNDLIKLWGDVPARFSPVETSTIYLGVTNRDEIYERIIADLENAENLVPWANEIAQTQTVTRVSKAFVKGLKARVCLMYAGYSLRSLDVPAAVVKTTFSNSKVCRTVSDSKKAELYAKARQACKDIMDNNSYSLASSFEKIFKDQCQDVISTNRESIFELPFLDGARGEYLSYLGLRHEFQGDSTKDNYSMTSIKGEVGVVPSFFYDYNSKDLRRDVTACPYKWVNGRIEMMSSPRTFYLGKWRAEWANRIIASNDDGVNFCVLRYADVLLMYAETENELNGGPTQAAVDALQSVRSRAFNSAPEAFNVYLPEADFSYTVKPLNTSLTKDEFFAAIVQEKAFEFCGENVRKWDLMRWGLLKDKMDYAIASMKALKTLAGRYTSVEDAKIYWKNPENNPNKILIFGLNPGENTTLFNSTYADAADLCTNSDICGESYQKSGKWLQKSTWITGTTGTPKLAMFDDSFVNSLYKRNPDEYQLFPFMNVILTNSQGHITNKYSY